MNVRRLGPVEALMRAVKGNPVGGAENSHSDACDLTEPEIVEGEPPHVYAVATSSGSVSSRELLLVFEKALAEDVGGVIVTLSELSEDDLFLVVDAAQLVDTEGQDYGDAWHGWAKVNTEGLSRNYLRGDEGDAQND